MYSVMSIMSLQGGLDVRDAASSTFLTEVASSLKDLHKLCGGDMTSYLQASGLPPTKLPQHVQVWLAHHLHQTLLIQTATVKVSQDT